MEIKSQISNLNVNKYSLFMEMNGIAYDHKNIQLSRS